MENKDYQLKEIQNYQQEDDEIDLMELLAILVREKVTILVTFIIVSAISLGVALHMRDAGKSAAVIIKLDSPELKNKKINLLPPNVLEKVYIKEKIAEKENISLDNFREAFKISGIIPQEIKTQMEFAEKKGETIDYIPENYSIQLRIGDLETSKKILEEYIQGLNNEFKNTYESKYRAEIIDTSIVDNTTSEYQDILELIKKDRDILDNVINEKLKTNISYVSYGFGYRDIQIKIKNLENIKINKIESYLEATNIVKNPDSFKAISTGRIDKLKLLLDEKLKVQKDYLSIIENQKIKEKATTIPKGLKLELENNEEDEYYSALINSNIKLQNEISNIKNQIKILELKNINLKIGTENEILYIKNSIKNIINDYNMIIEEFNQLGLQENKIKYGEMLKKASPITIVSESKAKLILAAGIVLGLFMGILMAFLKEFFKSFKKYLGVVVVFFLITSIGYSQEKFVISFSHKEITRGQNPDKTPLNIEKLIQDYIKKNYSIEDNIKINVTPIAMEDSYEKVKNRLVSDSSYLYIPTQYIVSLEIGDSAKEKEITDNIKAQFSNFYIDSFLNKNENFSNKESFKKENYTERLDALNNALTGIEEDIENRKFIEMNNKKKEEYDRISFEIWKIRNSIYRDLESYIVSNNLAINVEKEKILLSGEKTILLRELDIIKEKIAFYSTLLSKYNLGSNEVVVLENGDLAVKNKSSIKEKQYLEISNNNLKLLEKEKEINRKVLEIEKLSTSLRKVTEKEALVLDEKFKILEKEIFLLEQKIKYIELRDYKREYDSSVRITEYKEK